MNRIAAFLLPALLGARTCFADDGLIGQVRGLSYEVPAIEGGGAAAYKGVANPDYKNPDSLPSPNLKTSQVKALLTRMAEIDMRTCGDLRLTREQAFRLAERLVFVDRNFVDPIPTEVWDKILKDIGAVAEKELAPGGGNWDATIDKMLKAGMERLKNPFSFYWTADESKQFLESVKGGFSGVGIVWRDEAGTVVDFTIPDSPAAKAGLKSGDEVISVGGVPTAGRTRGDITQMFRSLPETEVRLGVSREGRALEPVTVTPGEVRVRDALGKMAAPDVGYVYIHKFNKDTDKEVLAEINRLKALGAAKIILDVRGNPGGHETSVSSIASEFLKDGQAIVSFRKQGVETYRNVADGDGMSADMPVVVLVDGGSASASEILAGCLQDHKTQPVIIGSRTYGKGSAQTIHPEVTGQGLKLTLDRWHTPKGRSIDGEHDPETGENVPGTGGITPDIEVAVTKEQGEKISEDIFREMHGAPVENPTADPVLQKALEVLSKP